MSVGCEPEEQLQETSRLYSEEEVLMSTEHHTHCATYLPCGPVIQCARMVGGGAGIRRSELGTQNPVATAKIPEVGRCLSFEHRDTAYAASLSMDTDILGAISVSLAKSAAM